MKNLTILLLLILSTKIYAQTEYYSTDDKNRISKLELDKMSEELKVKYTKILKKQMFVNIEIKNTIKKKDSIIHKISFSINEKKTESRFKNGSLSDLKNKEFINFNLINILGDNFNSEKLKGKPTLINFWFTKCAPCIDEMPILNQIYEKYKNDFNFIAVTYESKENVEKFLKKHPFKFEQLVNANEFIDKLGIQSYPVNLFLDKNNILRFIENGLPYSKDENGEISINDNSEIIDILEKIK